MDLAITPDPAKQAFYVDVEIDNTDRQLITGITQNVEAIVEESDDAIIVPRNLVQSDTEGNFVYVAKNDKAEKRYIQNGMTSGLYYKVNSGLNYGEELIVKGSAKLKNGSKINVID